MPFRFLSLLPLLLLLCSATLDAQPLRLGSSREDVMKVVYRTGTYSDTLGEESVLIQQLRRFRDTSHTLRYSEAVRVAPAVLFGLEGYGVFAFDAGGRLVHYSWMRRDMIEFGLGSTWMRAITWKSDVSDSTYLHVSDQILRRLPLARALGATDRVRARTVWEDSLETMNLTFVDGGLTLDHRLK